MSGILHLISRSNSRRHFLTFGNKKNPKNNSSSAVSSIAAGEISKEEKTSEVAASRKWISPCEVPRSPTLPVEIRQSRATKPQLPTAESRSPALVARLMGLDEAPEAAPAESVVEKRRESDGGGIARAGVLRGGLRFFEAFRVLGSLKEKGGSLISYVVI
ncbi:hypothetical protein HN51_062726 [Arachis hypogaea]